MDIAFSYIGAEQNHILVHCACGAACAERDSLQRLWLEGRAYRVALARRAVVPCQDCRKLLRAHNARVTTGAPPGARPRPAIVIPPQPTGLELALRRVLDGSAHAQVRGGAPWRISSQPSGVSTLTAMFVQAQGPPVWETDR